MKYSTYLENLHRAKAELNRVRFWCRMNFGYGEGQMPTHLALLDAELDSMIAENERKIDAVVSKFQNDYNLWLGTYIFVWNPDKPKHKTIRRCFISAPNRKCEEPHIDTFMLDVINKSLGCEQFVYEEPFDVYVVDKSYRVVKILRGNGQLPDETRKPTPIERIREVRPEVEVIEEIYNKIKKEYEEWEQKKYSVKETK